MTRFNGIVYFDKDSCQAERIYVDASLTGFGGHWDNNVYATPIYHCPSESSIVHLEMLNILVALRTWAPQLTYKKVQLFCDNWAVVQVVHSGRGRDAFLNACLRNIWLETASHDIELRVTHIRGIDNIIADILSRSYSETPSRNLEASIAISQATKYYIPPHRFLLDFSI